MRTIHSKEADKDTKTTIIKVRSLGRKNPVKMCTKNNERETKIQFRGWPFGLCTTNRFQITTNFK